MVNVMGSGDPLPLSIMARMIKYMILKRRAKDKAEKEVISIEVRMSLSQVSHLERL